MQPANVAAQEEPSGTSSRMLREPFEALCGWLYVTDTAAIHSYTQLDLDTNAESALGSYSCT